MSGTLERPRRAKGESMAEYSARREDYVATHRDVRNGNRTKLAQHDDALAYLLTPVAPDLDEEIAEARQERPELFSQSNPELDALRTQVSQLEANTTALRARIADLESRPPEVREVRVEVPAPAPVVVEEATEPYTPDFTLIPDALAKFAEADETATDFRNRLKRLWQRFGIADGEHFPGGGEPLTGEEKITMREIDIVLNSDEGRNAGLLQWLQADERNT